MADIFISYERSDRAHAERIAAALERHGWSVWWDRKLFAGETFDRTIQRALSDARCVIVLWSKRSVASGWVKDEAADGARRGILIPVLIDDVEIPLGFRQIHAISVTENPAAAGAPEFSDLIDSVGHLLRLSSNLSFSGTPVPSVSASDRPPDSTVSHSWMTRRRSHLLVPVVVMAILASGVALRECAFAGGRETAATVRDGEPGTQGSGPSPVGPRGTVPGRQATPDQTGQRPVVQVTGILVTGKGHDLYYVFDAAGTKQLAYTMTNRAVELFPGTYTVALNNVRQAATVVAKRQTVVETGTVVVQGSGQDLYYVYDSTGEKQLATTSTNREIELFPGTYVVALNRIKRATQVFAKRSTTVE